VEGHLKESGFRGKYPVARIFKYLVLMRILSPDSKRAACQTKDSLYGTETDFTLQNVYDSLGLRTASRKGRMSTSKRMS
jgi:hypothetical protein